jgi:hypothetical protein
MEGGGEGLPVARKAFYIISNYRHLVAGCEGIQFCRNDGKMRLPAKLYGGTPRSVGKCV